MGFDLSGRQPEVYSCIGYYYPAMASRKSKYWHNRSVMTKVLVMYFH